MPVRSSRAQVILYVSDVRRSLEYWHGKFGFEFTMPVDVSTPEQVYWAPLDAGGFELALHPGLTEGPQGSAFSIFCEDLEAVVGGLRAAGIQTGERQEPHPGVVFYALRDPDGHAFFLKPS